MIYIQAASFFRSVKFCL